MRFKKTVFYGVDELLLDTENYRFGLAKNQQECIDLIYKDSPESFENLLNDIIINNIGDYPLVFLNSQNEKVVLDGNRRVSILKIINNPALAPSKKIGEILSKIDKTKLPFDLNSIGCFVSSNKEEILKTVYERHAAGKGISRIQWSAFATAKFRFDSKIEDSDWRAIAILLHTISLDKNTALLINKANFSFEVFRRMVRHAYLNGYLHFDLFNEEKNVINSESEYLEHSIELVKKFIKVIENNEVGLSRGKNYASEDFLSKFFLHHFTKVTEAKPPRRNKTNTSKKKIEIITEPEHSSKQGTSIEAQLEKEDNDIDTTNSVEKPANHISAVNSNFQESEEIELSGSNDPNDYKSTLGHESDIPTSPQFHLPFNDKKPVLDIIEPSIFIESNAQLINSLNRLSIQKYNLLYQSITQLNIRKHPILAVIATWAFLDSLPRTAGWDSTDFTSYYNSHLKSLVTAKESQTDIRHSIAWIFLEGNCNKHSSKYVTLDHKEFIKHFNNIQPFIAQVIEHKILSKIQMANGTTF